MLVAFAAAGQLDTDSCGQLPAGSSVASSVRDDDEVSGDAAAVEQLDKQSEGAGSSAAANIPADGCAYHLAFYTSRRLGAGTSAQVRHYDLPQHDYALCMQALVHAHARPVWQGIYQACLSSCITVSPESHACTGVHRADWAPWYDWAAAAAQSAAELPRRPCCRSDSVRAKHQVWCKRRV